MERPGGEAELGGVERPEAADTVALNVRLCWARVENAVCRVPWLPSLSGVVALDNFSNCFL